MQHYTLREAYDAYVAPMQASRTASASRTAIGHFERLIPEIRYLAASGIRSVHLSRWKAEWMSESERTPQTFNKCLRHVRAILSGLQELEIVESVPRCRPLKETEPRVRIVSDDEIRRIYDACAGAKWPRRSVNSARAYWQSIVVVAYTTGLRRDDILGIAPDDICRDRCVLFTRQSKTGKLRAIPLHANCLRHLDRLKPEPHGGLFYRTKSNKQFYRQWHDIQFAAEIEEHYGIHDLRRTCGSVVYERAGLHAASELLAHSSLHVTRKHYIASGVVAESLRQAVDDIPQPFNFPGLL